jgi:hypothetical protein
MNTTPRTHNGAASHHTGNERTSSESQAGLQRAVRTLRAIRQRYQIDCMRNSHAGSRSVQVALGDADMCWIGAAIEALEEALAAAAARAAVVTAEKATRDSA